MALVLALGTLGVGYAMWSDEVFVTTTVHTGDLKVVFASQISNDPLPGPPPYVDDPNASPPVVIDLINKDPSEQGLWTQVSPATDPITWEWTGTRYAKNVGTTNCTYTDDLLTITLANAYPCYYGSVLVDVHNEGTVPAKLKEIRLMSKSKGAVVTPINAPDGMLITQCTTYYVDFEGCTVNTSPHAGATAEIPFPDDFSFHVSEIAEPHGLGQIDPCEKGWFDVTVHLEQGAEQGLDPGYDFTIKLIFCNWNE